MRLEEISEKAPRAGINGLVYLKDVDTAKELSPIIKKYFGKLAPISAAGVNSMDVLLPSITRYSGKEMIPIAILHGILIDISVPVFVSFFCNL